MEPLGSVTMQKTPPVVPTMNQINQIHTITSNLFTAQLKILLPSTPRFHKWLLICGVTA
jgi:hypothetical protein